MNPKVVAAWSAAAITVALSTNNPVYRVLVLLAALNFLAARRRAGTAIKPLLLILPSVAVIAIGINVLLGHGGQHVLARIPDQVPGVGGAITLESLVYGAGIGLGVAAAVASAAPLSMVLEASDLVDALPGFLHRSGAAIATSLSMVPGTARSFSAVREAQMLRGVRLRGVAGFRDVLVPVTLTTLESSIQLAAAMDARAFGSGPRTRAFPPRWSAADSLVAAALALSLAGFIYLRISGVATDWRVFPALTAPSAAVPAVLACLLLLAPAFA